MRAWPGTSTERRRNEGSSSPRTPATASVSTGWAAWRSRHRGARRGAASSRRWGRRRGGGVAARRLGGSAFLAAEGGEERRVEELRHHPLLLRFLWSKTSSEMSTRPIAFSHSMCRPSQSCAASCPSARFALPRLIHGAVPRTRRSPSGPCFSPLRRRHRRPRRQRRHPTHGGGGRSCRPRAPPSAKRRPWIHWLRQR